MASPPTMESDVRAAYEYRLALEGLILRISTEFINLPVDTIDPAIIRALESVARFADAVRSSVFVISPEGDTITNTHEWCLDPADSQIELLQGIPVDTFGHYMQILRRREEVVVGSLEDLPAAAVQERQWSEEHGFRPLLFVPMLLAGELHGTLGFYGAVGEQRRWPADYVALLKLVADVLVNALERRRGERELRRSEVRYRSLVDASPSVILCLDPDGIILDVNPEGERIYGCGRQEMLGVNYLERFVPVEARDAVATDIRKVVAGEPTRGFENPIRTADGADLPLLWNVNPLNNAEGDVVGIIAVGQDITELRRAERERRQIETQMLQAQKLESLGVMAGGIAHDFNNLLVGVLGNADLALEDLPPDAPLRPGLEDIRSAGLRAAELCKQMLAYTGRSAYLLERLDLNAVLRETHDLLKLSVSKKTEVRRELSPQLPAVGADGVQLRQVLMNLITNAAEAVGDAEGTITIRTWAERCGRERLERLRPEADLPAGEYVVVEVADSGCGITPEVRERIFEPFFTTKFTGRGLGLAAVQGIVHGHQGALEVESSTDVGTRMRIYLPAAAEAAEVAGEAEAVDGWQGSGTCLLVDDEAMVRNVARQMLERAGFEVVTASDGVEAIERFEASRPVACVLLDLTMPRMDGEETLRALRRVDPGVKVILASGFAEQELAERFTACGLVGVIQKPYRYDTLREKLRRALASA